MLPHDRAQPAAQDKPSLGARIMQRARKVPLIVKVLLVVFLSPLIFLYALGYAVVAVAQKRPGRPPAFAVATWGIPLGEISRVHGPWTTPLLILPFALAW